jgi:hypothetical protein
MQGKSLRGGGTQENRERRKGKELSACEHAESICWSGP